MEAVAAARGGKVKTREEWRKLFFAIIDTAAPTLERDAPQGDQLSRLPPDTMEFLRSQELLKLKLPAELGGAEADNALQFEVYERIAYYSAAASWCCFIYTDLIALMSSMLSEEGLATLFANGLPLVCGGGGRLIGDLRPVPGGYRVSGRWQYGSGISGSDWTVAFASDKTQPGQAEIIVCSLPTEAVHNEDNWKVLGLAGTGSADFSADDVFVPGKLTFKFGQQRKRGGPQFQLGTAGLISHTVPAVALGVARRVLDDVVKLAKEKQRGYGKRMTIGHRAAFQAFLGKADLRIKAARALMLENGLRLSEQAASGLTTTAIEAEARAAGTYIAELAVDIAGEAVRYAGGEAVRNGSRFERALRDVNVAATHYCVNNTSYEGHGQFLLGLEGADPEA
jgi:alkylation response protein AidB-like acyl-CoA dehydrogenase